MIDFAADTAAIFGDVLGADAIYKPDGGSPVAIRVVPRRPDDQLGFGGARLAAETAVFLITTSQVAAPAEGDLITYDGTDYIVHGEPERNERRLWWTVLTRPQS